ncbi:glutathione-regulated potassium-efflux system protein KefC [Ramlibacter sp. USB13]|uniref:Glutathione-regulated potassium-efflux system protein KefC n=1 Tax=Ramlibacter cellulosilyticus TaxID=2764187 RepID=A0A923MU55_9BURK|nr:glutathione-regulated potassium-efflux system protein KefC [Ramlibacter cellulosilyticus]MBC5784803.1 glutathione-regulated potassium-efflux system protein KefC [Ramlibacter cellulosilyticus]
MEHHIPGWLSGSLVYLAAAVIVVPLSRALGLGAILGYLAAGIVIGPWGLRLVANVQDVLHFAEFGVVLMLFLVGLELEPRRLWSLRRPIFGWGSVQLFGSAAVMTAIAVAFGVDWRIALAASLALADSSTATGLRAMADRNLLPTTAGRSMLSVLLLQDVAAIPILALLPLLMVTGGGAEAGGWQAAAKVVGVVAAIILGGRLLLRPTLRWIARSDSPEIFTAAALLLVVATAALMQSVGLSMALGAFLAGVLLAESEYRRELETDIEPFKGLLLGLFFIAIGMTIDFAVVAKQPLLVAAIVFGFLAAKGVVLVLMARGMEIPAPERPLFIVLLAQGGEVGFVVLQTATGARLIDAGTSSLLVAAITLSMLLTPLMLLAADRWSARLAAGRKRTMEELSDPQHAPVIIAGFGRYGQMVGRLLNAQGIGSTVLDHDADMIEAARAFGYKVHYGDATRLDLLRTAGAAGARVFVVAVDDREQSLRIVDLVREHFPQLELVARARDVTHWNELRDRGVDKVDREVFESSLRTGRRVLELLGQQPAEARRQAMRFRRHNLALFETMYPYHRDRAKMIAVVKEGRQQLEAQMAREREEAEARRKRGDERLPGWDARDD